MATPYLAISDGTTTITFLNGATTQSYFIEANQWAPSVAGVRKSEFGTVGTHNNVTEEINCRIIGTTAADCYSKLQILANLLEQAERFANGEAVSVVLLKFAPTGSALSSDSAPLQAMILGRDDGDETSGVALEPEWDGASATFHLPIRIRFKRRGLWTHTTEAITASNNTPGALATCTFSAAHATPCPIRVRVEGTKATADTVQEVGHLILGDSGSISLVEAETMTNGGVAASDFDASFVPSNNAVLKISTGGVNTGSTSTHPTYNGNPITIVMRLRSSVAGVVWTLTPQFTIGASPGSAIVDAPPAYFSPADTSARTLIFPAVVPPKNSAVNLRFGISLNTAWVAQLLYIDFFYIVRLDPNTRIIRNEYTYLIPAGAGSLVLDPGVLTTPEPHLQWETSTNTFEQYVGSSGELVFASKATAVLAVWIPDSVAGYYRGVNSGAVSLTETITCTRHMSYLTPQ